MKRAALISLVLVLALCAAASAQVVNGSFEVGAPGFMPAGWALTGGSAMIWNAPDELFPTQGNQYLRMSSGNTGPTTAGWGPHAPGTVGQVTQTVQRPNGAYCGLFIDWEWLPVEALTGGIYNDFISIDVVDANTNSLIQNVLFLDTGRLAGVPPYTNVPGAAAGVPTWVAPLASFLASGVHAPAGYKRAFADLSAVPVGTSMRIEITLGNGGDPAAPCSAYIDNVRLTVGERNGHGSNTGSLRVLESSHTDGLFTALDGSGDFRNETPYTFRAAPGQRIVFRASGSPNTPWALVMGAPADVGMIVGGYGIVNLDLTFPLLIAVNGFDPVNPINVILGTMNSSGYGFLEGQVPETVPLGVTFAVQGIVRDTGSASSYALTAATTITIASPQIPVGDVVAGGASVDDGIEAILFNSFGLWPFYGSLKSGIFVSSNGNCTFDAADPTAVGSEASMVMGPPRIALLWDDLNNQPALGGTVRTSESTTTFTVSYEHTVEAGSENNGNTFALLLYKGLGSTPSGVFTLYFGSTTMSAGLVGITPGGLSAPTPGTSQSVDLSSTGLQFGQRVSIPAGTSLLELFGAAANGLYRDSFDLLGMSSNTARITFVPNGSGGYTAFAGTR